MVFNFSASSFALSQFSVFACRFCRLTSSGLMKILCRALWSMRGEHKLNDGYVEKLFSHRQLTGSVVQIIQNRDDQQQVLEATLEIQSYAGVDTTQALHNQQLSFFIYSNFIFREILIVCFTAHLPFNKCLFYAKIQQQQSRHETKIPCTFAHSNKFQLEFRSHPQT